MSSLTIDMKLCMGCDVCIDICAKANAISKVDGVYILDQDKCENCKACVNMCMVQAIVRE